MAERFDSREKSTQVAHRDERRAVIELLRVLGSGMADLSRVFALRNGIDHTAARALVALAEAADRDEPVTAGALGRELGLSAGSVTALTDRMIASGHVRREVDPTDRRRVLMRIEPDAQRLGGAFFGPLAADIDARMTEFDDESIAVIGRFLEAVIEAVDTHVTAPVGGGGED